MAAFFEIDSKFLVVPSTSDEDPKIEFEEPKIDEELNLGVPDKSSRAKHFLNFLFF